jgi:hypothetical protein
MYVSTAHTVVLIQGPITRVQPIFLTQQNADI